MLTVPIFIYIYIYIYILTETMLLTSKKLTVVCGGDLIEENSYNLSHL